MSVCVCIVNKNGISLAADSAGTCNVLGSKMVYNSMNKLFSISSLNKIGALTYGNTAIHNVPIDILLNKFSNYLDEMNIVLNNFFEIIEHFKKFLIKNKDYFKFDNCESQFVKGLIDCLIKERNDYFNSCNGLEDEKEKINGGLEELRKNIDNGYKIPDYNIEDYIVNKYGEYIIQRITSTNPIFKKYPDELNLYIKYISEYFLLDLSSENNKKTGLLFAGYSSDSVFPKFYHFEIRNFIGTYLKYVELEKYDCCGVNYCIRPLAQPDVINTFCTGISEDLKKALPNITSEVIGNYIDKIILDDQTKAILKSQTKNIGEDVLLRMNEISKNNIISPLLNSLQLIPLFDMASLAENLVNITSLKRKFMLDGNQQTVGGPTDVAIISPIDGFKWVKRKEL